MVQVGIERNLKRLRPRTGITLFVPLCSSHYESERNLEMEIGQPQRELIVEPLELPEPLRVEEPAVQPKEEPVHE